MAAQRARRGYFALVLHSHLPYVLGHGGWPHGTDWLYEAACETYIPLLRTLFALRDEGITPKVTVGITPILAEQLADAAFVAGLDDYIEIKTRAARDNGADFTRQGRADFAALAQRWQQFYAGARADFAGPLHADVVGAFRELGETAGVEIITSAATHAYLPLLGRDESIGLELHAALAAHRRHFGSRAAGIWLPECAYRPGYEWRYPLPPWADRPPVERAGLEDALSHAGLSYFVVDTHLLEGGRPLGVYAARFDALRRLYEQARARAAPPARAPKLTTRRPYYVGAAEPAVACFGRNAETGLVVWSGEHGYPGDGCYLDFHKKHSPGGLRYWRVTAPGTDLAAKEPYRPDEAAARVAENADHFVSLVRRLLAAAEEEAPIIVAAYDAELFGHWWHEGPAWLGEVLRRLAAAPDVELITCGEYLQCFPPDNAVALPEGSWGEGGFHSIWLNADTEWSWRLIYEAEDALAAAAATNVRTPLGKRFFSQALREFLLLAASDWQFLITTWSARDYAEGRVRYHYGALRRLLELLSQHEAGGEIAAADMEYLAELERTDRPFPDLAPGWFAPP